MLKRFFNFTIVYINSNQTHFVMKKIAFILFVLSGAFWNTNSVAQEVKAGYGIAITQTDPQFPGGADSLASFFRKNISSSVEPGTPAKSVTVWVSFIVDKAGKIVNPSIVNGFNKTIDDEALRVIRLMPDWKPGTASDTPVDTQFILPVRFSVPLN